MSPIRERNESITAVSARPPLSVEGDALPLEHDLPVQGAAEMLSNSTEVCFLDKLQVLRLVPVSMTGLHDLMVEAGFPRPYVLNGDPATLNGKSYWLKSEVVAWMLSRPKRVLKIDRAQEDR